MICNMNNVLFTAQGGKKPSRRTDRQRDERTKKRRESRNNVGGRNGRRKGECVNQKAENVTQEGRERERAKHVA